MSDDTVERAAGLIAVGDRSGAQRVLVRILQEDVNHERAWLLLGEILDTQERKIYAFRQVLRINPENTVVAARLAELLNFPEPQIISPTIPMPGMVPDRQADLRKAEDLINEQEYVHARELLRSLINQHPDCGQAWYLFSKAGFDIHEEKVYLRQALRVDPEHAKARHRLGWLTEEFARGTSAFLAEMEIPDSRWDTFKSFSGYTIKKIITLFATVVVGIYLTILVANLGGHVDEIFRGMIAQQIMGFVMAGGLDDIPEEEEEVYLAEMEWNLEEAMGLHEPFLLRSVRFLVHGLTLNFGESFLYYFFRGVFRGADESVRQMVLTRLPYTLVLVGISNLLVFLLSVFAALFLSRKYGSWLDRLSAALASFSAAPSWIFGIILIVLLSSQLRILPFPKVIDLEFAEFTPRFIRLLLSQLVMPVLTIFLSVFFQGVYTWRTFFLIYSQEDYVDMARSMGLPPRKIERQYILRPTFPYVITNFALMMITVWESTIALEILFYWPGIGPLFLNAVNRFNTAIIVAVVIVFAYLLAFTVFLLDILYAVFDPRVRLEGNGKQQQAVRKRSLIGSRVRGFWKSFRQGIKGLWSGLQGLSGFFRVPFAYRLESIQKALKSLRSVLKEVWQYPTAIIGLVIILLLVGISVYTVITIPYGEAVERWRTHTSSEGIGTWERYPRNAAPAWINVFRRRKLPETIILNSADSQVDKEFEHVSEGTTDIHITFAFDYQWDEFPDGLSIFFTSQYQEKAPHVSVHWLTPDGREIRLASFSAQSGYIYRITQDDKLERKLQGLEPRIGLFADPTQEEPVPLEGRYLLRVDAIVFEEGAEIDGEFILYGQVYGLAGTDHHRRDLMLPLLWGTPVALAFGLLGAIGTSIAAMLISAFGVWYGGWLDGLIQRITEVNIILPTLPIAIMIFVMYSKSIWVVLGVIILLNIFGSAIKNYRSAFLQVKESAFIQGAVAYGAKDGRIVSRYLLPRIIPVLLPQLVILVPGYVFYEATLAYLGLSDPYLPTWGKVVYDAISNGALQGYYYWILEPISLLMITGLAFALLGIALDRVINPRLREI